MHEPHKKNATTNSGLKDPIKPKTKLLSELKHYREKERILTIKIASRKRI